MNRPLRIISLLGILAISLPVACTAQPPGTADAAGATSASAATSPPAQPLVTGLPDFTRLVEQVAPAVVNISARSTASRSQAHAQLPDIFRRFLGPGAAPRMGPRAPSRSSTSVGSGFLISADGYVLTNHHVIAGADEITVTLSDRREFEAELVGSDKQYDVALLKIDGENLPMLRTGSSHQLQAGQWVVAIGQPFGLAHSVTAGIVSAVGRANPGQQYVPFIQTDVAINRGNSGGPLLNTSGEVVGINSQIFSNSGGYMGVSFAIPIDLAMNAVQQIKRTGHVSRGQLGVQIERVTPEKARALELASVHGALVTMVSPGSAAAEAGIERMDVIIGFDGSLVEEYRDLPPLVGSTAPGTEVEVEVFRDGERMILDVALDAVASDRVSGIRALPSGQSSAAPGLAGTLGLVVQNLSAHQRQRLKLGEGEGVLVTRVTSESARDARLRSGDIILAVGHERVGSVAALSDELSDLEVSETVMLLVRRGGITQHVAVRTQRLNRPMQ